LSIESVSENNSREHWSKKHKRHRSQKRQIALFFLKEKPPVSLPCEIRLTRISPRFLDDDNLSGALKWIRDAIADQLIPGKAAGRADDDKRITWTYKQEKGHPQAIKIEFR